jgi:hypothetical protein
MNKNGDSSNAKEKKLKILDSINKALNNKKVSEEFNISLNTLNTKNSCTIANAQSSGKSKTIPEILQKKNAEDKLLELNRINPSSELDLVSNENNLALYHKNKTNQGIYHF